MRIGQGIDIHRFSDDPHRPLVLGGVVIEGGRGLAGHSDADAVCHALADAVLGAVGLGDLGRHFPDTDPVWEGANSVESAAPRWFEWRRGRGLRRRSTATARWWRTRRGWPLTPRPWPPALSAVLGAPVSVKATRAEGLGALGRAEGIACLAVVLLEQALTPAPRNARSPGGRQWGRQSEGRTSRGRIPRAEVSLAAAVADRAGGRPRRFPIVRTKDEPSELGGDQVEGRRAVLELLTVGRRTVRVQILLAEDQDPSPQLDRIEELAAKLRIPVETVPRHRLDAQARTEAPQGVLALARPMEPVPLEELCTQSRQGVLPFLLVAAGITDPRNLGALLRSAECAGVNGVVLPRHPLGPPVADGGQNGGRGAIEHLGLRAVVGGNPRRALSHDGSGGVVGGIAGRGVLAVPLRSASLGEEGPIARWWWGARRRGWPRWFAAAATPWSPSPSTVRCPH